MACRARKRAACRLEKVGPTRCPIRRCIRCAARWEILGAGALDARSGDRARTGARQVRRGGHHCRAAGVQCGTGLFQESRAQATLTALKSRLALNASVRRDGAWKTIPAAELVPGDLVKLSLGGVVAADVTLTAGEVLLDQSMLTGESVPIEAGRACRHSPARWYVAARPWRRSRRPACAPSSVAPRNWCAPLMS
jgi:hypothetical protein